MTPRDYEQEPEYTSRDPYERETYGTKEDIQRMSEKSTAELEEEISHIRADMDSTLDAIERRFSAGEIVDRFLHSMSGGPREYAFNLGRALRDNPVPATLTGLGLVWLMMSGVGGHAEERGEFISTAGQRTVGGGRRAWQKVSHSFSEKMHQAGEKVHQAGEKMSQAKERARGMRHSMGETAGGIRYQAHRANNGFQYLLHEQPLVLAAIGIGFGALMGSIFPATRKEAEVMGEAGEQLRSKSKEFASQQMDKVEQKVKQATESAREEAERRLH